MGMNLQRPGQARIDRGSDSVFSTAVQEMLLKEWPNGGSYDFLLLGCIWDPPRSSVIRAVCAEDPAAGTYQFASRRSAARRKCYLQAIFFEMWASTPMLFGLDHPLVHVRKSSMSNSAFDAAKLDFSCNLGCFRYL